MADTLKKFGKFFLLDLLAQGGMAEIYRARHATPTGGGRLLAMKRIMQSYSSNAEFINMFRGETKVTSGFTHPNIVQVYDYGEEQGQLYIAMEYVDGRNLRQFITRLSELKALFPIEVSCFIVEQSAQALHYAHDFKDKFSGKSLNIIHRDVSPQNILVSYDGAVKVIDFGIAKAETQSESTRAGIIKGKPSYLSPEQISGEVLDGRSDVFALAVVFWELLTGKKLFAGDNDLAVIRMVESCQNHIKPPSMFNPKIPKELDAIVLKALEKDRNRRYQSAGELQRAIHKFLYQFSSEFNPADLSFYARDLFKNEILEDRKRLHKLNEKAEQLLSLAEIEKDKSPASPPQPPAAVADTVNQNSEVVLAPVAAAAAPKPDTKAVPKAKTADPKAVTEDKTNVTLSRQDEQTASSITLENAVGGTRPGVRPTGTRSMQRPGGVTRTGTLLRSRPPVEETSRSNLPKVAALLFILLGGGYYFLNHDASLLKREPAAQVSQQTQDPLATATAPTTSPAANTANENAGAVVDKTIMLQFKISPAGGSPQAKINGIPVNIESGAVPVKLDQVLEVTIDRPNFQPYRKTVMYESQKVGSSRDTLLEVELIPLKYGFLSISTTPSAEGYIFIEGAKEPVQTPLSGKRLPVGTYKVRLENKLLQMSKEITVVIQENQVKKIEERLSVVTDSN